MVQVLLNGVLLGRTFTTTEIYIFFISEILIHVVACLHVNVFALFTFLNCQPCIFFLRSQGKKYLVRIWRLISYIFNFPRYFFLPPSHVPCPREVLSCAFVAIVLHVSLLNLTHKAPTFQTVFNASLHNLLDNSSLVFLFKSEHSWFFDLGFLFPFLFYPEFTFFTKLS